MQKTLFLVVLSLALGACRLTIVETDCLKVIASKVQRDGGRVRAESVYFRAGDHCPLLQSVSYVSFRERNGVPGYQPDGVPPDVLVSQVSGDAGGQPSSEITIANIDNQGHGGDFADSWEVSVIDADGHSSVFSGNF